MRPYLICSGDCLGRDHISVLQTVAKAKKEAKNRDRSKPENLLLFIIIIIILNIGAIPLGANLVAAG